MIISDAVTNIIRIKYRTSTQKNPAKPEQIDLMSPAFHSGFDLFLQTLKSVVFPVFPNRKLIHIPINPHICRRASWLATKRSGVINATVCSLFDYERNEVHQLGPRAKKPTNDLQRRRRANCLFSFHY